MRTFHIGGAASQKTKGNKIQIKNKGILTFNNIKMLKNKKNQNIIISRSGKIHIIDKIGNEKEKYKIPYGALLYKNENKKVKKKEIIATWDPHTYPIISEINGKVKFKDFIEGITINKKINKITGLSHIITIPNIQKKNNKNLKPSINIINEKKKIKYVS
jgi:DNA-directed RNA polymerase subunit beta'